MFTLIFMQLLTGEENWKNVLSKTTEQNVYIDFYAATYWRGELEK